MRPAASLAILLALLAMPARAGVPEPVRAVQGFFASVASADYAAAWGLLTETSRGAIVARVAREQKTPAAEVRAHFDRDDDWACGRFWEPFRVGSKADRVRQSRFSLAGVMANQARVEAVDENRRVSTFLAFKEAGTWRFGLIEGMPPGNPFQP